MNDFYAKALSAFPAQLTQIVPTGIQNNYVNVQSVNSQGKTISIRKRNTYRVLAQNKDLVTIQPSAGSPSNWVNGAVVDFRIEKGAADVIDFMVIRVKLTNGTGAGVVLAPVQLQIQRVDFLLQNGSTLIHSIQGHELYEQNAFLPRNEFENICASMYLTENYASAATSIADGTSTFLNIPLWSPWLACRLHPSGLDGNIMIRVYTQPIAQTTVSGGALTCNEVVLQLHSRDQPQSLQNEQNRFYADKTVPTVLSFLNIQRMPVSMPLAASTKYDITLTGIKGIASCMFFTIRPAVITASNCITYTAIDTYDLLDASGNSLLGSTPKGLYEQIYEYATCFNNKFRKLINFNFIPFSQDPVADFTTGSNNGYQPMTGFERLTFTTPAGLSSASYSIDIVAYVQDEIKIINGMGSASLAN